MPKCSIKWCGKSSTTSSYEKDDITFHRFPTLPEIKERWIAATNRDENWFPSKTSVVCSRHFRPECFRLDARRRILFKDAIPTLLLPTLVSAEDYFSKPTLAIEVFSVTHLSHLLPKNNPQADFILPTKTKEVLSTEHETLNKDTSNGIPSFKTTKDRRLLRSVVELTEQLKQKNILIKRLQYSNRMLKQKVQRLLQQIEKK